MQHFLVMVNYLIPAEQLGDALTEHRAFLQTGYDAGLLLMSGPRSPRTGGLVVARAESLAEIQSFFKDDPYQVKGLATYEFIPFDPVKRQPFLEDWVNPAQ
ncbi:MAG: hypothetical protein HY835_13650 [Anaerolineae bacterium]|nr:hypothetical protein [Anaerolineae bacterium]